jgi:ABC-type phosphate/phosphonate transport system substrate-binding protein
MDSEKFIACGMYATNAPLQQAWQQIFDQFFRLVDQQTNISPQVVFDGAEVVLRDPALFLGHTCGYPLMSSLQDQLLPFCVPVFDVEGCDGTHYSSQIIVANDASIQNLNDCRGTTVAINHIDSNSGMNVLRYALAKLGATPGFLGRVEISGGHWQSIEAVANGTAHVAAIDCVSLQLARDCMPELVSKVRTIAASAQTGGLPFVIPRSQYNFDDCGHYVDALNRALDQVPQTTRDCLHLTRFEGVKIDHYQSIMDLEKFAVDSGYPELN